MTYSSTWRWSIYSDLSVCGGGGGGRWKQLHGNQALGGVKLHIPLRFPCLKSVKDFLQAVTISLWFNRQVDGSVVDQETHLRGDVLGEVVDVGQEKNRQKDRALRYTRCHRDRVWFLTLNNDPLLAIA